MPTTGAALPQRRSHDEGSRETGWRVPLLFAAALFIGTAARAGELPLFDFARPADVEGWQPTHDIARLTGTPEGLSIEIAGGDPYTVGPPRDFPDDQPLFIKLRLKSEQSGVCQIFYFADHPSEENSVRLPVKGDGAWEELEGILPALGPKFHFRIDPPGSGGTVVIAAMSFRPRAILKDPEWPHPAAVDVTKDALTLTSGDLELAHARNALGAFVLRVAGKEMARGHNRPVLGAMTGDACVWSDWAANAVTDVRRREGRIEVKSVATPAKGPKWVVAQTFSAGKAAGTIDVETRVQVENADADAVYVPLLMLLPGAGTFGEKKGQGLFAGLEYLDDEPSSSEADLIGPASKRRVPDELKITFPLMAVQAEGRYVGLVWEMKPEIAALFDSPDRTFRSGGHAMGLIFPGANAFNRVDGNLLPHAPQRLKQGETILLNATIIGGAGDSIIPAVQQYVALRGLPPVPQPMDLSSYVALAASGWLDSKLGDGNGLYRHALWPGFNPQPAADAAILMDWLAMRAKTPELVERLHQASKAAIGKVQFAQYNDSGVSHVRYPLGSLCYGHVEENAERAEAAARAAHGAFEPDGSVLYKKRTDKPDYGKTHFARDANGLTVERVWALLEQACFAGDKDRIAEGLRLVRALDKFNRTVPRGAQTWECPLHTPDILASANLVRAYTRAYELTGEQAFLDRAEYWAWTGVPFLYLRNPTDQTVGVYGTIAVLGATNWQAPIWIGLPVQWCGLVYADGLYRLSRHTPRGPWRQIADGITACGIQMTWPQKDSARQGLLPDSYILRSQLSDGPAINPGTVQANAARFFEQGPLYDFHASRLNGWYVHVPGAIVSVKEEKGRLAFTVQSWLKDRPYFVLVSGLGAEPRVKIDDVNVPLAAPHQFLAKTGRLILQVKGNPKIELQAATE
jgi:hypothetical protein